MNGNDDSTRNGTTPLPDSLAGYHKVASDSSLTLCNVILFNGEDEKCICVRDYEYEDNIGLAAYELAEYPGISLDALYKAPIEREWEMRWHVHRNIPMVGLNATVSRGRRKGGHGIVERIYPIHDRYGRVVAEYVALSDGTRTNVRNCDYSMPGTETA